MNKHDVTSNFVPARRFSPSRKSESVLIFPWQVIRALLDRKCVLDQQIGLTYSYRCTRSPLSVCTSSDVGNGFACGLQPKSSLSEEKGLGELILLWIIIHLHSVFPNLQLYRLLIFFSCSAHNNRMSSHFTGSSQFKLRTKKSEQGDLRSQIQISIATCIQSIKPNLFHEIICEETTCSASHSGFLACVAS